MPSTRQADEGLEFILQVILTRIILSEIRFIDRFHSGFLLAIACNHQSDKVNVPSSQTSARKGLKHISRSSRNEFEIPACVTQLYRES